ncbi:MAG: L,D-transpeptidase family protein [Desulfamplus sp.]|nr:L,D-transpeptidase family protein [Desulfamplus sp.]
MFHISKNILVGIGPFIIFCLIWVVPHLIMIATASCVYGDYGINLVAERGRVVESSTVEIPLEQNLTGKNVDITNPAKIDPTQKKVYPITPDLETIDNGRNGVFKSSKDHQTLNSQIDHRYNQTANNYAINIIPSSLVNAPREGASAIVVEKDSQTLWLYTSKKGEFVKVLEMPCSTGEVGGPKAVEGDKKTPEGIYFLKKIHEERFLTPIYGKRAFTTDYPNFLDRALGKTGSAIWIHGTNKRLKPMDSNGCIAMNNDDVVKLNPYSILDETPVIILDRVDYVLPATNKVQRDELLDFLSRWVESLNKGSYLEYLFYYSSNYLPDVRWWAEWVDIRSRTALAGNPVSAQFEQAGIYRHKDHFVILLDFKVSSRYRTIAVGKRKLFIKSYATEISSHMSGGVATGMAKSGFNRDNSIEHPKDRALVSAYCADDSYKIIGDVFQKILMDQSSQNNYFITAAARLDEQHKVK